MLNGTLKPLFPATQKDVTRLRQSATDAVSDLSGTAYTHANKVSGQLRDLADHIQAEGTTHLKRARGKFLDVTKTGRDLAFEHPLACIGAALAIGFIIGWSRSRRSARRASND